MKKVNRKRSPALIAIMILVCAMSVSCIDDGAPRTQPTGEEIVFAAGDAATRGTVTGEDALRKIGVFGYSHAGGFADDPAVRIPDYFLNQAVIGEVGSPSWSYSGVRKYWPREGINLSLFAYAPYIDVEDTFTLYPAAIADTGAPTIDYTVPAGIVEQIDLLWGNRLDQTYDTNGGVVAFEMKHALTRVDFEVCLEPDETGRPFEVEFTALSVNNIIGGGVLDLSKSSVDAGLWTTAALSGAGDLAKYLITPGGHGGLEELTLDAREMDPDPDAEKEWHKLFKAGQYLMLIPQPLDGKGIGLPAEMTLEYTVTNVYSGVVEELSCTLPLSITGLDTWEPGMGITYRIAVSLIEGLHIEFDIEGFIAGTPWENEPGDNPKGTVG